MLSLVIELELVFLFGNAPAETVVVPTFWGIVARPFVIAVVVVGPFVDILGPFVGVRVGLLVVKLRRGCQRYLSANAMEVVGVDRTCLLLGVLDQYYVLL